MIKLTQEQVDAVVSLLQECRDELYITIESEWGWNAANCDDVVKKVDKFLAAVERS